MFSSAELDFARLPQQLTPTAMSRARQLHDDIYIDTSQLATVVEAALASRQIDLNTCGPVRQIHYSARGKAPT